MIRRYSALIRRNFNSSMGFQLPHCRFYGGHKGLTRKHTESLRSAKKIERNSEYDDHDEELTESTGMDIGNVVELPADELTNVISQMRRGYNPRLYAFTMFETIDIVRLMLAKNLIPRLAPEEALVRWFIDPDACFRRRGILTETLGEERWQRLSQLLMEELNEWEKCSPLLKAIEKHNLDREFWTSFLRGVSCVGIRPGRTEKTVAALLSIARNGSEVVSLPENAEERVRVLADLLISVAREYGRLQLATVGVQLLGQMDIPLVYEDSKALTKAVSRAALREMDWTIRRSGALLYTSPKWILEYKRGCRESQKKTLNL